MSQINLSKGSRSMQKLGRSFNVSMAELNPSVTRESIKVEVNMFMAKRRISRLTWYSFIFLCVANLLTLLTSVAPGWGWTQEINGEFTTAGEYRGTYGIWFICWNSMDGEGMRVCETSKELGKQTTYVYVKTIRALDCCTMITGFSCFIILGAYMCVPLLNSSYKILGGYIAAASIAAFFNIALFVTFCVMFLVRAERCCDTNEIQREIIRYGLSYCFILSCAGAAAFIASAIASGCEIAKMRKAKKVARKMRRKGLRHYDPQEPLIDPRTFVAYNNPAMFMRDQHDENWQ